MDDEYCTRVVVICSVFSFICTVLSALCAALAYEILHCCDEKNSRIGISRNLKIKGTNSRDLKHPKEQIFYFQIFSASFVAAMNKIQTIIQKLEIQIKGTVSRSFYTPECPLTNLHTYMVYFSRIKCIVYNGTETNTNVKNLY